jgi:hypothetical protein
MRKDEILSKDPFHANLTLTNLNLSKQKTLDDVECSEIATTSQPHTGSEYL